MAEERGSGARVRRCEGRIDSARSPQVRCGPRWRGGRETVGTGTRGTCMAALALGMEGGLGMGEERGSGVRVGRCEGRAYNRCE